MSENEPQNNQLSENKPQNNSCKDNSNPTIELLNGRFFINSDKNLFQIINSNKIFIQKLRKNIFNAIQFEEHFYFIDTFGDCFILKNNELAFLFGILSTPSFFIVSNNRIYTADKYSRVWVHDLDGEIINIAFIGENITDFHIGSNYCCVVTDGKENKIEYKTENKVDHVGNNNVKIFDRSFDLLRTIQIEKLISFENDKISYVNMGNIVELKINDHNARKSLKSGEY